MIENAVEWSTTFDDETEAGESPIGSVTTLTEDKPNEKIEVHSTSTLDHSAVVPATEDSPRHRRVPNRAVEIERKSSDGETSVDSQELKKLNDINDDLKFLYEQEREQRQSAEEQLKRAKEKVNFLVFMVLILIHFFFLIHFQTAP